jgi:hypothetical protein
MAGIGRRKRCMSEPSVETNVPRSNKLLTRVWLTCLAVTAVVMVYGLICYPAAPYHHRDGAYYDKLKRPSDEKTYRGYLVWQSGFFCSAAVLGLVTLPLLLRRRSH